MARLGLIVRGVVQGVGFRPFVYRIARAHGLAGFVQNQRGRVAIEVQGERDALDAFLAELGAAEAPARVDEIVATEMPETDAEPFVIRSSEASSEVRATLPADLATCADCQREVATPGERRYRYPFTNCTRCGPRYSIVESLPYDRARTSMKGFALCAACAAEYANVADRRFHAQPIACPKCGPRIWLLDAAGVEVARDDAALDQAVRLLCSGRILALRGLGGFQLLCDATDDAAVQRLRERKRREQKPFALLFPDLSAVRAAAKLSFDEERALMGPEAPIVLLRRTPGARVAPAVAPDSPLIGVMLPYTPLHALLVEAAARALVCTSGNLSEEPMATDLDDALERLGAIADAFLTHDRPIVRPVDDSLVRLGPRGTAILRRARGFAPQPVAKIDAPVAVLALGAHMKGSIALCQRGEIILSQHLGDLESPSAVRLLERTIDDFLAFFDAKPDVVACDLHPDYASTRVAERIAGELGARICRVQHHHAHVAAVMAEHGIDDPVLGLAWDGTGFGSDGTVWGGEVLRVNAAGFERVAALRGFRLPGGDRAMREPRRSALGLVHAMDPERAEALAEEWFGERDGHVLSSMLAQEIGSPLTSSMGRLFDAVAALVDLGPRASFEGQIAMQLEHLAERGRGAPWPIPFEASNPLRLDWRPMLEALLSERDRGVDRADLAASFHASLAELALRVVGHFSPARVVLGGGCFQNRLLETATIELCEREGFSVLTPRTVPVNDGGIAVGQAWAAAHAAG
jgi:hydrogenase maturation protein HypF